MVLTGNVPTPDNDPGVSYITPAFKLYGGVKPVGALYGPEAAEATSDSASAAWQTIPTPVWMFPQVTGSAGMAS